MEYLRWKYMRWNTVGAVVAAARLAPELVATASTLAFPVLPAARFGPPDLVATTSTLAVPAMRT